MKLATSPENNEDTFQMLSEMKPTQMETDEQIHERIAERFDILNVLTEACILGNSRAMIVSGPAGLGKSYSVEHALAQWDPNGVNHIIVKGYVRATGLVKTLWSYKEEGQVIVFDDADAIFFDDVSLNLLKAVCDTTENRTVSWLSEGALIDDETSVRIPRTFAFDGAIIFLTNYDFDSMMSKRHKLAPHLEALVSRAHYIDLSMKSRRDYLIRIQQVLDQGLLRHLSDSEQEDVLNFINDNINKLREISLRMAIKLGSLRKSNGFDKWERIAKITCCRN
jgi:hypothetical protein